jgi:membrane protein implicated in regulation of membrane protease activity
MELWWQALNLELQIFYGIGILALLALVLQFVLLFFGGFDDATDLGDAGGVGDHGSGLGIFSFRGITAFFLGFGFLLMRSMMRLQSSGTLNYQNAVGEVATVYVTIPAEGKAGGQVEVMIQGRLSVAEALHKGVTAIAPGTKVKVVEMIGRSTLVVEPLLS